MPEHWHSGVFGLFQAAHEPWGFSRVMPKKSTEAIQDGMHVPILKGNWNSLCSDMNAKFHALIHTEYIIKGMVIYFTFRQKQIKDRDDHELSSEKP